jgi:serine O-acetyltransferase
MIKLFFKIRVLLNNNNLFLFRPLFYFFHRLILWLYGASIPLNTRFCDIPTFPHSLYGIFISGDAVIGKNATIFQQVTIGSVVTENSKRIGSPYIKDNVLIGAGAKVIGNVKIGNNVKIGANCVVVENIQDDCTVILPKNRILKKLK